MAETMKEMYNEILKLTSLNRHEDGSHEVKSLELERVTTTIHNLWVDAVNEIATAEQRERGLRDALEKWCEYTQIPCNDCEFYPCGDIQKGCASFVGYMDCCEVSHKALSPTQDKEQEPSVEHRLKQFARYVIRQECWSIFSQDGFDLQKLADELGLIISHPATEDDVSGGRAEEIGDPVYEFSKKLKEQKP
jgi:hypothetical protein